MTDAEREKAINKALREDAKRPADEYLRDLYDTGVIDASGRVFSESLALVADLLRQKGFTGVSVFHKGRVPGGVVHLHEKIGPGRGAEGPYDTIRELIEKAHDHEALWDSLATAGYVQQAPKTGKKKTG